MRKSYAFFAFISACLILTAYFFAISAIKVSRSDKVLRDLGEITATLKLTDMSFSTDARYTRHPSQADLFSAFQDYPGAIDHFPSGSVIEPPDFSVLGTSIRVVKR